MIFEETVKTMANAMKNANEKKTTPYDSVATVTRVEDGVAWVHIAGGVDETPVKMTIDCKEGDEVQVRVGGGRAWIVGNATAPPTDDTLAIEAKKTAEIANESAETALDTAGTAKDIAEATNQHFWTDDNGVHVASQSKNATAERNTLWNSLGMLFRKGSNVLLGILTGNSPSVAIYDGQGNDDSNVVARFGTSATLGKLSTFHTVIDGLRMTFFENDKKYGDISPNFMQDTEEHHGIDVCSPLHLSSVTVESTIADTTSDVGSATIQASKWVQDTFGDWFQLPNSLIVDAEKTTFKGEKYQNGVTTYSNVEVDKNGNVTADGNIKAKGSITAHNHSSAIGTVKQANTNKTITTTGIDTYTQGASITLEAGTWVVIGTWVFNTGSSTGARNITCALSTASGNANSGMLARTRVHANSNAWASLQATYLATLSASTTVYVKGSSTMTYTSESNTDIRAVRIA